LHLESLRSFPDRSEDRKAVEQLGLVVRIFRVGGRHLVAIGLVVLFLALAAVAVGFVVNLLKSKKRLFDASLGELERDEAELGDGR